MNFFESCAGVAVRRPIAVCATAVAVALVGIFSLNELPIDLLPDIKTPSVVIAVNAGDRPPEEMQRLYGERLENLVLSVQGVRSVEQIARTGRLVATVHLDWESDVDNAVIDIGSALSSLSSDPQIDYVTIRRFDPSQEPILTLGMLAKEEGNPDLIGLRQIARRQIATALETLPGVAEVRVIGGRKREISVHFDEFRAAEFGITLDQLHSRIAAENREFSAGVIEDQGQIFTIRGVTRYEDINDIENVVVQFLQPQTGGARIAVRVHDVADVVESEQEHDHVVLVNGREGVGLSVYKEAGANTVTVSNTIKEALAGAVEDLPGVDVHEISDNATLVVEALDDLRLAAGLGIALAILVLAVFLRSVGATFIVSAAVPVSILAAIFCMSFSDHSLNIITLGGLALGAGMLVDNAIVVVESMYRRIRLGDTPAEAAKKGTGLVAGAITASTLTTCVVFIPVFFVQGLAARLIDGIAFTVVISLGASLFVAIFLIPALGRWFLTPAKVDDQGAVIPERVPLTRRAVEKIVRGFLRVPFLIVVLSAGIVGGAVWQLLKLGTELLPPSDPKQFSIRYIGQSGQRVEATTNVIGGLESSIRESVPEYVAATLAEIGRLPDDERTIRREAAEENTARLTVRITDESPPANAYANALRDDLDQIPNADVEWELNRSALSEVLDSGDAPVVVEIAGSTLYDIREVTESVQNKMLELDELWNVRSSFEGGPPELRVKLNRSMADALQINVRTVAEVIQSSLEGREITRLAVGDEEYPIMLQIDKPTREELKDVTFTTSTGIKTTIGEVTEFEEVSGAREILRKNQRLTSQITALVSEDYTLPQAIAAVDSILQQQPLTLGMTAQLGGAEQERATTFSELQLAAILAFILVLMVLAGTFESLLQPITILYAIPLALVGVAVALVPMGNPLGVMSMLGLIVLSGVAVNDAVLLIVTAKQLMQDGKDRVTALSEAAGIRLRPITMTTLTTALALTPLLFGGGEGAVLRQPMALTIIGGLVASTIGSLFILPCLYLTFDKFADLFRRKNRDSAVEVT
ncbi:MAG: efflux RND transporter permease subunit [Gammaproteobacteria bacterium]|nr:efflux RND transporter permease subunit [Gammaproteobacteria bacterium]